MWVEEVSLENIKSFDEKITIRLGKKDNSYKWVTLLGENGEGMRVLINC